jgi:mono/diheme cytochrome c family protein
MAINTAAARPTIVSPSLCGRAPDDGADAMPDIHALKVLMAVGLWLAVSSASAQTDLGKREFENSCASCHGLSARGDGVLAKHLTTAPSDLTLLTRRNGGVFPAQRVSDTIDGRSSSADVGPHGAREMPVWGNIYRAQALQPGEGELTPGWYARGRVLMLVDYLARIQQK